jgi:hypothetical protein
MLSHSLIPAIVAPLLALAIWRRVRSQFGRQPIRRGRMVLRIGIFAVLGVVLAASGLHQPHLLEGLLGGALAGAALGLLGLRLTRFERDPLRGDCYVPNPWIGGLLTALLLGRLAWRFAQLLPHAEDGPVVAQDAMAHAPALGDSPLTLLLIGLLIGYYLVYFAGLLVHHRRYLDHQSAAPPT